MLSYTDLPTPVKCLVRKEYLFDMDADYIGDYVAAIITGASSYTGTAIGFDIITPDGAVFHNLPAHALCTKECEILAPEQATYHDSPDNYISATVRSHYLELSGCTVKVKTKRPEEPYRQEKGKYLCTFDWYQDNIIQHLIALDTGQLVVAPSHKILFRENFLELSSWPKWKKLHREWSVEN